MNYDSEAHSEIVGVYFAEDSEEDDGYVTVIASVEPREHGFVWSVEDTYVGYVGGGWEATETEAMDAAQRCADEWCTDSDATEDCK